MTAIKNPRGIINRKALTLDLHNIVGEGYSPLQRRAVLALFKDALIHGQEELRRRFDDGALLGPALVQARAYLIDQLVRTIHDFASTQVYLAANPTKGEELSVVAVGGYGRRELAPYSDVDLLFLVPYKQTPYIEQMVEFTLYMLWDMGLSIGHATRSVDECIRLARQDLTIRTALLDSRDLWGSRVLFEQLVARFNSDIISPSVRKFVEDTMAERDARHDRMGDTRYLVEPNIKEGKGGLRDMQTLFWIVKCLYKVDDLPELVRIGVLTRDDAKRFRKAYVFLWTVRCHLHYLAGRADEHLTFDVQRQIGDAMGYGDRPSSSGVERFMKHFYLTAKEVGNLTRVICAVLEEDHTKRKPVFPVSPFDLFKRAPAEGFKLDSNRLALARDDLFETDPVSILRLFHVSQNYQCDIHPKTLRLVTQNLKKIDKPLRENAQANRLFMEMLTSKRDPGLTLRRMNEAGVLGRFLPDFGRVVAQMQYDMYHVYTVDEHTVRAIAILAALEAAHLWEEHQTASEVIHKIQSRQALYVAVLLHDIAKGRGGDHSVLGAQVAIKLCPRLGLSDEETETVAWLVRHHLAMSRAAFKRDVNDPRNISQFTELVQSPERLHMLLVLTEADIRAVGPNVWNAWKAGLLKELYFNTLVTMTGDLPQQHRAKRVEQAKKALRARLSRWPEEKVESFIDLGYPDYWLSVDLETKVGHAQLYQELHTCDPPFKVATRVLPEHDVTEVTVLTADHPGLFGRIAGSLSLSGAAIVDAKVFTMTDGMALDSFSIQDDNGRAFANQADLDRLVARISDNLSGRLELAEEIGRARARDHQHRTRVFKVPARVLVDNQASSDFTVIEINGRDRTGLLFDIARAITGLNLQIGRAHVATYGEQAVDVFYVKDLFGLKLRDPDRIRRVIETLKAAVEPARRRKDKEHAKTKKPADKMRIPS